MTRIDEHAGTPADTKQAEDLEVRIARQLLGRTGSVSVAANGPGRGKRPQDTDESPCYYAQLSPVLDA
jgi:hypothetical protein